MFRHKRIAIDFDGTLFEDVPSIDKCFEDNTSLTPKEGAAEVTRWLKKLGFELLIFTCRPDYHRNYLEAQMAAAEIAHDYILFYTKPRVDLYIDDKGFRFTDWTATRTFIETHLYQAENSNAVDQSPETGFEQHRRDTRLAKATSLFRNAGVTRILDVGCARGEMAWKTQPFDVDGFDINNEFLNMAAGSGNYRRLHEQLPPLADFDAVTLFGVLEHIKEPAAFLEDYAHARRIFITVPNGGSFHRHVGRKLELIKTLDELSLQDRNVGHHHYFLRETLQGLLDNFCESSGHHIVEYGSCGIKFGTNPQMAQFLPVASEIDDVSIEIGLTGAGKFLGAEIYAYLEISR